MDPKKEALAESAHLASLYRETARMLVSEADRLSAGKHTIDFAPLFVDLIQRRARVGALNELSEYQV